MHLHLGEKKNYSNKKKLFNNHQTNCVDDGFFVVVWDVFPTPENFIDILKNNSWELVFFIF